MMNKLLIFIAGMWTATLLLSLTYNTTTYQRTENITIIHAVVTMYTSDPAETDDTPTITASGQLVRPGTIACPSKIPFGTQIEIKGKRYTCTDRMATRYRKKNYFDIWTASKRTAINHGRQTLNVKVIHTETLAYADR